MNKPLKQSVRNHLDSYSLSEDQLNKLESLAEQNKPVTKHRVSIYPITMAGAVAAFLAYNNHYYTPFLLNSAAF